MTTKELCREIHWFFPIRIGQYIQILDFKLFKILTFNHTVYIATQAKCTGVESDPIDLNAGPKQFAVLYTLEGGAITCSDNQ